MGRREHQDHAQDGSGHRGRSHWRRDPGWLTWTIGIAVAIVAVIAIPVGLTSLEDRTSPSQKVRLATCGGCAAPDGSASSSVGAPFSMNMGQGDSATSRATPTGKASPTAKGKSTPTPHPSGSSSGSPSAPASGGGSAPASSAPATPHATVYVSVSYGLLGGYDADVTIDADPGDSFPDWTLQFSMPGADSSDTSGVSVHHGEVTASGGDISSGGSTSFSFSGDGSPESASGCVINGTPCTLQFSD